MTELIVMKADTKTWAKTYACANFLINEGVPVTWATEPFTAHDVSGTTQTYARGTIVATDGEGWQDVARERFGLEPIKAVKTSEITTANLKRVRIGLYGGGGAPMNHARIFAELGFQVDFISPHEIKAGGLEAFDILIMPGGGILGMFGQLHPMGEKGCEKVAEFVTGGGMYIGACAGSFNAAITPDIFVKECPQQKCMQLVNAGVWNDGEQWLGLQSPGVGVIESHNIAPTHPLMFGMPERFPITHYNGPIFTPVNGVIGEASDMIGFATVGGATEDFTPAEYFLRWSEFDAEEAKQNTLLAQAERAGRFNIVGGHNGAGRVVLFGSHPEFGFNLAMDEWNLPARMLANAAFWQAGTRNENRPLAQVSTADATLSNNLVRGLEAVSERLPAIARTVDDLRARDVSQATWLGENHAMSTFGLSGREIWAQNIGNFAGMTTKLETAISDMMKTVAVATELAGPLRAAGKPSIANEIDNALLALNEAVHYRAAAEHNHDFGYEGALQTLDRVEANLTRVIENFGQNFKPSSDPYAYSDTSPFQLSVGSYLSALGIYGGCWSLLRIHHLYLDELVYRAHRALGKPL